MAASATSRAQSAMEYLMTYGWAILIVAVVLVILYQIGIFGSSTALLGTSCIASTGYLCASPQLNTTGNLIVQFAQSTGQTITLTGIACTNSSASPSSMQALTQTPLAPGQKTSLTFSCPLSSNTLGTKFSGYLWVQYNTQAQSGNIGKVAAITAAASTTGPVSSGSSQQQQTTFSATCGGTQTVVAGNDICTFTSSGTFTVTGGNGNVAVLVVGGGGGAGSSQGSYSGGGGAGGFVENDNFAVVPMAYSVTVGFGGPGGSGFNTPVQNDGGNSVFNTITAIGGGGGGASFCCTYGVGSGASGGSGGGGGPNVYVGAGGSGTAGQGSSGGVGAGNGGGGGGGAGAAGGAGTSGAGGVGLSSSIPGSLTYYAGGGGGGPSGTGGTGGGASGGHGASATPNTGGGGGGSNAGGNGGAGGSGIVIIAWNALGNGNP